MKESLSVFLIRLRLQHIERCPSHWRGKATLPGLSEHPDMCRNARHPTLQLQTHSISCHGYTCSSAGLLHCPLVCIFNLLAYKQARSVNVSLSVFVSICGVVLFCSPSHLPSKQLVPPGSAVPSRALPMWLTLTLTLCHLRGHIGGRSLPSPLLSHLMVWQ